MKYEVGMIVSFKTYRGGEKATITKVTGGVFNTEICMTFKSRQRKSWRMSEQQWDGYLTIHNNKPYTPNSPLGMILSVEEVEK